MKRIISTLAGIKMGALAVIGVVLLSSHTAGGNDSVDRPSTTDDLA